MTVLHWSGANRNLALGKLLFDQKEPKVDPWIRDRWGRLAVDLALETGNQTLIDLFHRHMFPEDYENDFDPLDPPKGVTPIITPKPGL
jgi:ankyrin repeat protein